MINLERMEIIEGVTVYGDDTDTTLWYAIPNQPRFRTDAKGRPVFTFLTYALDAEARPSRVGAQGRLEHQDGAYCVFDVEFSLPDGQQEKMRQVLQEKYQSQLNGKTVDFAVPDYTDGTAELLIKDEEGHFIQHVWNTKKPSLVGKNITSFTLQLTKNGAALFKTSLKDGSRSLVQIVYALTAPARLGGAQVTVEYSGRQIRTLMETIATRGNSSVSQWLEEVNRKQEFGNITLDFTSPQVSEETKSQLRTWAYKTLSDQMTQALTVQDPVDPEQRKRFEAQGREEAVSLQLPYIGWFWHWFADQTQAQQKRLAGKAEQVRDFKQELTEHHAISWQIFPQGTLPSITSLKDSQGCQLKWEDFRREVKSDQDDFFRRLRSTISVNADFAKMGIFSVQVYVEYPPDVERHWTFKDENQRELFEPFLWKNPDDGRHQYDYIYWFTVNFKGQSKAFESEKISNQGDLSVNVGALGVLAIKIENGQWPYPEQDGISRIQIMVRYKDDDRAVSFEQTKVFSEGTGGTAEMVEPVFTKITKPLEYQVTYSLDDAEPLKMPWTTQEANSERYNFLVQIPNPFVRRQNLQFIGNGVGESINRIILNINYAEGHYKRSKTLEIKEDREYNWKVPVPGRQEGTFTYSGVIQYKANTAQGKKTEKIPETVIADPNDTNFVPQDESRSD